MSPKVSENAAYSTGLLVFPATAEVVRTLCWFDSFRTGPHSGTGFGTTITPPPNGYEPLVTIQPWGDGGQESMGPNRLRRAISTTASGAGDDLTRRLNVCGRPLECKHVVRTVRYAVRCSLMSDLSIAALHACSGPVWRCADRVRTLWRARSPCIVTGFPNPVSLTAFPYPSSGLPTFPASSMRHPPHHPPHLAEDVDVPGEA